MSQFPTACLATSKAMKNVGKLTKVIGTNKGIVSVWHDPFIFAQIPHEQGDFIFIALDGLYVPFQLLDAKERPDGSAILYFSELNDGITVDELVGNELYLPPDSIALDGEEEEVDELFDLEHFIGHRLIDQHGTEIGAIIDYELYSLNQLLVVERAEGSEVLIPIHPDLVLHFPTSDTDALQLQIADGLLDS